MESDGETMGMAFLGIENVLGLRPSYIVAFFFLVGRGGGSSYHAEVFFLFFCFVLQTLQSYLPKKKNNYRTPKI